MELTEFWTICSSNSIILDKEQLRSVVRLKDELIYWNEKVNLISRKDIENVLERHILHSLMILKYISFPERAKCLDIGTGGGLPGIPLKIARPDLHMFLIDSIKKKLSIADMLASHTGQKNFYSQCIRAEEMSKDKANLSRFDFIISRAVASIYDIVAWSKPMLKKNGQYLLLKGGDLKDEIDEAKQKHPKIVIETIVLKAFAYEWFETEEKKLVKCYFKQ